MYSGLVLDSDDASLCIRLWKKINYAVATIYVYMACAKWSCIINMFSRYKLAFRYELNTCVANSSYPCATSGLSSLFSNFSECVVHFGCRCQGTNIVRRKDFSYSWDSFFKILCGRSHPCAYLALIIEKRHSTYTIVLTWF